MSKTLSDTLPLPPRHGPVLPRRTVLRRLLKWAVLLLAGIWLADTGISLVIQYSSVKRKLTAHLETAFGRQVEVGRYSFSLWGGPALEAQSITVAEDPRFGHEYFLRAESLRVELSWQRLLLGHVELGALSLTRPSLNLVRNADGIWNLAEWLPRPAEGHALPAGVGPVRPTAEIRFRKINIDRGRINFKQGDTKLPFAFTDVEGIVEAEGSGSWRVDLEAAPLRAAVPVQQPGTLHLTGHVGGTSSRLRPAALVLSWSEASITDVLRLVRSYDYGVFGTVSLSITAETQGDAWVVLQGRAELRQLHRWDLPMRPDNPELNVLAKLQWDPSLPVLYVTEAALEAPHSRAQASGGFCWGQPRFYVTHISPPCSVGVSATLNTADLLSWAHAFHPGVADDLSIRGNVLLKGVLSGWPPQLASGAVSTEGADLASSRLRVPVRVGAASFQFDAKGIKIAPVVVAFGALNRPSEGSIRFETSVKPRARSRPTFHLTGSLNQIRDLTSSASVFGWSLFPGWDVAGPVRCDLRWQGMSHPWEEAPTGTIDWGNEARGATLRAPFLNLPIEQIRGHVDLRPGGRKVMLSSAQAFGARWSGTFDRRDIDADWKFNLSASGLTAAELNRWINPRWQESFLDRMLPFLNPRSPSNAAPGNLHASGRLTLEQFTLAPLLAHHLQTDVKIDGRRIELSGAKGQFYGGEISGSFRADLQETPVYRAVLGFSGVDLRAMTASAPGITNLFAGSGSGQLSIEARGTARDDLLASLECKGSVRVSAPELRNVSLMESLRESARRPGTSLFREASASFTCGDGKVQFRDFTFEGVNSEIRAAGSVDFNRNVDLRLVVSPTSGSQSRNVVAPAAPVGTYQLTGNLTAPQIVRIPPAAQKR